MQMEVIYHLDVRLTLEIIFQRYTKEENYQNFSIYCKDSMKNQLNLLYMLQVRLLSVLVPILSQLYQQLSTNYSGCVKVSMQQHATLLNASQTSALNLLLRMPTKYSNLPAHISMKQMKRHNFLRINSFELQSHCLLYTSPSPRD